MRTVDVVHGTSVEDFGTLPVADVPDGYAVPVGTPPFEDFPKELPELFATLLDEENKVSEDLTEVEIDVGLTDVLEFV